MALSDATGSHFGPLSASELHLKLAAGGLGSEIYGAVSRLARENQDEIEARFPKIMRRVSGYNLDEFTYRPRTAHPDPYDPVGDRLAGGFNLSRMVVGSEGTLCVVTEAKVNLVPRPPFTGVSVVHLNDIFQGGETTAAIMVHQPSAIELVDRMVLDRCRESRGLSQNLSFLEGDPGALLLVEFYGNSEKEVAARMDSLKLELAGKKLGLWLYQSPGQSGPKPCLERPQIRPGAVDEHPWGHQAGPLRRRPGSSPREAGGPS